MAEVRELAERLFSADRFPGISKEYDKEKDQLIIRSEKEANLSMEKISKLKKEIKFYGFLDTSKLPEKLIINLYEYRETSWLGEIISDDRPAYDINMEVCKNGLLLHNTSNLTKVSNITRENLAKITEYVLKIIYNYPLR